jgi:hypothetical protein
MQLYFGVSFDRSPRPRQPSGGRGLVQQAALRPSKPVDLKPQALTAPSRRPTRHPGRDQLWLALRV